MTSLSKREKETIILFNEEESTAECFTYNVKMTNRLNALCEERPDDVRLTMDNGNGGHTYTFPKSWLKITPKRIMTKEQLDACSARMKELRAQRLVK